MIETGKVIEFFDGLAPKWDEELIKNDDIINNILDNTGVAEGKHVLEEGVPRLIRTA